MSIANSTIKRTGRREGEKKMKTNAKKVFTAKEKQKRYERMNIIISLISIAVSGAALTLILIAKILLLSRQ